MVRLGQNFLADPNLLDAIVRDADLSPDDVVLEVGAGEGVLTERLAAAIRAKHGCVKTRTYPGIDHIGLVGELSWLRDTAMLDDITGFFRKPGRNVN